MCPEWFANLRQNVHFAETGVCRFGKKRGACLQAPQYM